MKTILRTALCSAIFASLALTATGQAGTIGSASINDVTLGSSTAGYLSYGDGINPQSQGPGGGSTGFGPAFAATGTGSWMRLAAFDVLADNGFLLSSNALGPTLKMTFDRSDTRHGSWTVANTSTSTDLTLDLVFAIHTGGGSGAFLFDGQLLKAGTSQSGQWALNMLNDGGNYSGYSNLTIFGRDAQLAAAGANGGAGLGAAAKVDVAEPGTLPVILTGLALLGVIGARRRQRVPRRSA